MATTRGPSANFRRSQESTVKHRLTRSAPPVVYRWPVRASKHRSGWVAVESRPSRHLPPGTGRRARSVLPFRAAGDESVNDPVEPARSDRPRSTDPKR